MSCDQPLHDKAKIQRDHLNKIAVKLRQAIQNVQQAQQEARDVPWADRPLPGICQALIRLRDECNDAVRLYDVNQAKKILADQEPKQCT